MIFIRRTARKKIDLTPGSAFRGAVIGDNGAQAFKFFRGVGTQRPSPFLTLSFREIRIFILDIDHIARIKGII